MTRPAPMALRGVRKVAASMADRDTPFVANEWYVAAFADEIGRTLTQRTLLDKRVVLFRTSDGRAVALDDRCAHRSFPLSAGRLDGDTLVCGYHGFRYDAQGDCIEVPSQATCPKGIGVHAYPLAERGPLLWIWPGDAALADESKIPGQRWMTSPDWVCSKGYFHLQGNYVSLHENLLDLTHLSFVHAQSFGTPDYARAPFETRFEEGRYAIERKVIPTTLPPVWAEPTGLKGPTAARIATSEFLSPGLHNVSVTFYDSALPEAGRREFRIRTAHIPTPEASGSTHYFIVHGRDFAQGDDGVTRFMHEQLFKAFEEDVAALQRLEEVLSNADAASYEMSVASDVPAVTMRKYLKRRAEAERGTHAAATTAAGAAVR
jgi:phenylpropionate dioxygenase-like ring-hydroxylating dioxygenase large terminal subunit